MGSCTLISSFLLGFLLEKFKFPAQTGASLFPGRSGFRAASSEVTCWENSPCQPKHTKRKNGCLLNHLLPPALSCAHSILKKCAATSPPFPFVRKVTGIFPHEEIRQVQVVTSSAPTRLAWGPELTGRLPALRRGCSKVLLCHQHLPLL